MAMGWRAWGIVVAAYLGACVEGGADAGAPLVDEREPLAPGVELYRPEVPREQRAALIDGRKLSYQVVDGEVVMGGDMLYGPVAEFERQLAEHGAVAKDDQRWDMPIRYTFDDDTPSSVKAAVVLAMSELRAQSQATISFKECTGLCLGQRIKFDYDGQGCASPIGKQLLGNKIHLDWWCDGIGGSATSNRDERGSIMHEIMHSLGLEHEQTRCDRDNHVRILSRNIESCDSDNLTARHCSGHDDLGAYDFRSVMHYAANACARSGTITIQALVAANQGLMGNRSALSTGDREALRRMYGSNLPPPPAPAWCGDGMCNGGEDAYACPSDCGSACRSGQLSVFQCPIP
jgi:hypothetical protein